MAKKTRKLKVTVTYNKEKIAQWLGDVNMPMIKDRAHAWLKFATINQLKNIREYLVLWYKYGQKKS